MPLCGGRSGAGTGQGWGTLRSPPWPRAARAPPLPSARPLRGCSRPPLRRLTGFQSELRNPGLSCERLKAQGRGSALGRYCQRLPRLPGPAERCPRSSCTSSHGAPAPALSHTHTPQRAHPPLQQPQPSACGSSALLEIIASFLLLLLLLLLLQSPPQPGEGSQRHLSLPRPSSAPSEPQSAAVYSRCPSGFATEPARRWPGP